MAISRTMNPATSSARAVVVAAALLALASCRSEPPAVSPAPPADATAAPVREADDPSPAVPGNEDAPEARRTTPEVELDHLPQPAADAARSDDAPLPAPGEVPAFLAGSSGLAPPPLPPSAGRPPEALVDDSFDALMKNVRFDDDGEEGSFASVIDADPPAPPPEAAAPPAGGSPHAIGQVADGASAPAVEATEPMAAPSAEDPCADLVARIDARMGFMRRVAAERDSYAYVENEADATALRLLAAMRRCAEHPEDEDCKAPAMEVELRDVEPPRHQFEVWPTDLEAEHKDPDEVPQDPQIRELLHQLQACRRSHTPQPLLDRRGTH